MRITIGDDQAAHVETASGHTGDGPTIVDVIDAMFGPDATLDFPGGHHVIAWINLPGHRRADRITAATGPIAHGI